MSIIKHNNTAKYLHNKYPLKIKVRSQHALHLNAFDCERFGNMIYSTRLQVHTCRCKVYTI